MSDAHTPHQTANGNSVCGPNGSIGYAYSTAPGVTVNGAKANARLWASAPDLLAACQSALSILEHLDGNMPYLDLEGPAGDLRDAITKATGQ